MLTGSTAAFQRRSVMVFLVRQNEEDEGLRPKTKTTNTTGGSSQNHHHARAKTKAAHDVIVESGYKCGLPEDRKRITYVSYALYHM